ncbi:MAG: exodeoxyribonuclease VII large subunit [Pelagibacteraceae bacterium]|nr:exodeoxyribonuclease VII large subunit [Pelagibacteraceae bacterium]
MNFFILIFFNKFIIIINKMTDNKLIDKIDNDNIPTFSVSEITKEITDLLEDKYSYVKIKGEISGETGNKYPEIYFTLKDEENVISAIIKRNKIPNLKFLPEDGLEVVCIGKITAYTKRDSKFQIDVDFISIEGEGQLLKMKEKLRKKLEIEGLFDSKYKRDIPLIPDKIGIITSPSGSVIKDMQRIIFERFSVPIDLFRATVQGDKAVKDIISGIEYFNSQKINLKPNVIIIARGGGSIEDLWCFNNEELARSVFNSKIPIISAIGHEPDINIIDYVADLSLATPSHAAKRVVPERKELLLRIKNIVNIFVNNSSNYFSNKNKKLDLLFSKLKKPDVLLNLAFSTLNKIEKKFIDSEKKFFCLLSDKLKNEVGKLEIGSHQNTLKRGYTYIKDSKNNLFLKRVKNIKNETNLKITFYDGTIDAIPKKK